VPGSVFYRIVDGKIAEFRGQLDMLGLMQQLGAATSRGVVCLTQTWKKTGPNPLDRGRPGSKRHVVTGARGAPLTRALTGAHEHDSKVLEDLVESRGFTAPAP
jgi:hypothetical protein